MRGDTDKTINYGGDGSVWKASQVIAEQQPERQRGIGGWRGAVLKLQLFCVLGMTGACTADVAARVSTPAPTPPATAPANEESAVAGAFDGNGIVVPAGSSDGPDPNLFQEVQGGENAVVPEPTLDEPAGVDDASISIKPEPQLEPVVGGDGSVDVNGSQDTAILPDPDPQTVGDTGGVPNDQEQKVVDPPLPTRDEVVRQLQEKTNVELNLGGLQISEDGLIAIEALCDKGLELALFDFQADIDTPNLNADTIFNITYDYASLVVANDAAGLELRRQLVENGYSMISQQLGLWYALKSDIVSNSVEIRVYFDAKGDNDAMIRALRNGVFSVFPFVVDGKVLQQPQMIQGTNAVNGSMLKPGIKAEVEEQTIPIAKRIQ